MPQAVLRISAIVALIGLSRSTVYRRIRKGVFPLPVSLGGRAIGFLELEIEEWLGARAAERQQLDRVASRPDAASNKEAAKPCPAMNPFKRFKVYSPPRAQKGRIPIYTFVRIAVGFHEEWDDAITISSDLATEHEVDWHVDYLKEQLDQAGKEAKKKLKAMWECELLENDSREANDNRENGDA